MTWASNRRDSGSNTVQHAPTASAAVDRLIGHALQRVTLGLPVQRLMLAELLIEQHGQQARPRPSARDHMEWRRCLADFLAVTARELLAHRLNHLPLTRHRFQRPGHVFAELAQATAAAAFARRRRIDHYPLAREGGLGTCCAQRACA